MLQLLRLSLRLVALSKTVRCTFLNSQQASPCTFAASKMNTRRKAELILLALVMLGGFAAVDSQWVGWVSKLLFLHVRVRKRPSLCCPYGARAAVAAHEQTWLTASRVGGSKLLCNHERTQERA